MNDTLETLHVKSCGEAGAESNGLNLATAPITQPIRSKGNTDSVAVAVPTLPGVSPREKRCKRPTFDETIKGERPAPKTWRDCKTPSRGESKDDIQFRRKPQQGCGARTALQGNGVYGVIKRER